MLLPSRRTTRLAAGQTRGVVEVDDLATHRAYRFLSGQVAGHDRQRSEEEVTRRRTCVGELRSISQRAFWCMFYRAQSKYLWTHVHKDVYQASAKSRIFLFGVI